MPYPALPYITLPCLSYLILPVITLPCLDYLPYFAFPCLAVACLSLPWHYLLADNHLVTYLQPYSIHCTTWVLAWGCIPNLPLPCTHLTTHPSGTCCRSLGVFTDRSLIRRFCMRVITNVYFEGFVLMLVLLSSVLLALDTPSLDDSSRLANVITICDLIFVACFSLEMCLKVGS